MRPPMEVTALARPASERMLRAAVMPEAMVNQAYSVLPRARMTRMPERALRTWVATELRAKEARVCAQRERSSRLVLRREEREGKGRGD